MSAGRRDPVAHAHGHAALIDTGRKNDHGTMIAAYLADAPFDGVGTLMTVRLLYSTHYDTDHIGASDARQVACSDTERLRPRPIRKALLIREKTVPQVLRGYLHAFGNPDGDIQKDKDQPKFIRNRIKCRHIEYLGRRDQLEFRCVAVRGDRVDFDHDLKLHPVDTTESFDENTVSIALLVRLSPIRVLRRWRPDLEGLERQTGDGGSRPCLRRRPGGNHTDVLKVNHHGSDTSSGSQLAGKLLSEIAIISTEFGEHGFPKRIVLKQIEDNGSYGRSPAMARMT